jgi:hypothetical protein
MPNVIHPIAIRLLPCLAVMVTIPIMSDTEQRAKASKKKSETIPAEPVVKQTITRWAYRLFIAGVGLLLIGALALTISVAVSPSTPVSLVIIFTTIAVAGAICLGVGVLTLFRRMQKIEVEVTPERLYWREGQKLATLEFNEVERVELRKDKIRRPSGKVIEFPVVRFIENDDEMMEFEISFDDNGVIHHSRFDAHRITKAVLKYVKKTADITPEVQEFVKTGYVDIDALPKR